MARFAQKSLRERVRQEIITNRLIKSGDKIIVALSGGPDSVCLLFILKEIQAEIDFDLLACHYNHRLREEESDRDEAFVQKICREWGIECIIGRAEKGGLYKNEDEARRARYAFFRKILNEQGRGKVALAHNANDLAETVILRLARGTGLRGLRSIPLRRENYIRPLLSLSRTEIVSFLDKAGIAYRVDKSNFDIAIPRNYVRWRIMPELLHLNPNLIESMIAATKAIEDDYDFLEKIAQRAYAEVLILEDDAKIYLDYKYWATLHLSLKRLVIRLALEKIGGTLTDISAKQIAEVVRVLSRGVGGKYKPLPHALRVGLQDGKIFIAKEEVTVDPDSPDQNLRPHSFQRKVRGR
ncbi:MAG: tRNA lysidine(34) synthetase TilS [Patescibacteria group bacterium]